MLHLNRLEEIIAAGTDRIGTQLVGAPQHAGWRVDLAQHHRLPGAHDAGLLGADGLAVFAQPIGMVDVDGGDHRHIRIDDVDRIQAPAQADFQHCQIQRGALEQPQGRQRAEFEIGQRGVAARCLYRSKRIDQLRVAGLLAIDTHALVVAQQMRRGVGTDLPAGSTPDRLDKGHGRALAIGPAHDDGMLGWRCDLQARSHLAHALQSHRDTAGVLLLDVGEPLGECGGVVMGLPDAVRARLSRA